MRPENRGVPVCKVFRRFVQHQTTHLVESLTLHGSIQQQASKEEIFMTLSSLCPIHPPPTRFTRQWHVSLPSAKRTQCPSFCRAAWNHYQQHGAARIIPRKAVVLILTDEHQRETIFEFFKYPAGITDIHGKLIAEPGLKNRWVSRDFVDSPDLPFSKIVRRFADAGFLESERDEFDSAK